MHSNLTNKQNSKDREHPYQAQIIKIKRGATYALMVGEQLSNSLWRGLFWTIFFCGLWMMQLPELFEMEGLYAALAIYLSGLIVFLFADLRTLDWPDKTDIDRRMEFESRLKHRPLSELNDKPTFITSPDTQALWDMEQNRRRDELKRLKMARWRSFLSARDTYGLRLIAMMIFIAGLMVAGTDWKNRLIEGFIPLDWRGDYSELPPVIVTITPPEYTKLSQIVLQGAGNANAEVKIPSGSTIKILMHESITHPYLVNAGEKTDLNVIEDGGYQYEWVINAPDDYSPDEKLRLDVKQFYVSRYGFDYTITPDTVPKVTFQDAPKEEEKPKNPIQEEADRRNNKQAEKETAEEEVLAENETPQDPKKREPIILPDAQVQLPLKLYDDYGVKTMTMRMNLDPIVSEAPIGYPQEQIRSVMSPPSRDFSIAPTYDFTDSTWAGLPVTIDITVTDHIGQTSSLETIEIQLPEREFEHPIAKRLVALRKRLAWEPVSAAIEVYDGLSDLLEYPQDFQDDKIVYLTLSVAASRLKYAAQFDGDQKEAALSVMSLLWDTALRIEDGNLSIAARNLRYAQMAVESALQNPDITDEQINELMAELRAAMGDYLMEFQKELQKKFAEGEELLLTPEMLKELMDPDELADFLGQMENEMLSGNTDQAQGMLSQLQRMLDMLNPNMALPMPENMIQMAERVSELEQLIEKQEELLEQTEEQKELYNKLVDSKDFGSLLPPNMDMFLEWGLNDLPPPPSQNNMKQKVPGIDTALNKSEQDALRYVLGQLMFDVDRTFGKIPEKMGLAEREMLYSSDDLRDDRPDESTPHQELAIKYLKEAQQEMQQEMQEQMEQMAGAMGMDGDPMGEQFGQQFSQRGGGMQYDPLGRPLGRGEEDGGMFPDSNVKIPDEAERKRVEEILRILRERSGELFRPREELEYFRRLLRQF